MRLLQIAKAPAVIKINAFDNDYDPRVITRKSSDDTSKYLAPETLWPYPPAHHPYMRKRKIRKATVDLCEVMYDELKTRIGIPVRDFNGGLVGIVWRPVGDNAVYDNAGGSWASKALLGAHLLTKDRDLLYLVEGPFDWLRMVCAGFRNTLCLLGSSLSPIQEDKIRKLGFRNIALCFDNDDAGWDCFVDCVPRLKDYVANLYRLDYDNFSYDDLGDEKNSNLCKALKIVPYYKIRKG
jgi:hypothetical protein